MKLLEALILYLVLYAPALFTGIVPCGTLSFSVERELVRVFAYNIPSLALICYLLLKGNSFKSRDPSVLQFSKTGAFSPAGIARIVRGSAFTFILSLAGLFAIAALTAALRALWEYGFGSGANSVSVVLETPTTVAGWFVLCLSCLATGYCEEGFFRLYLSDRLRDLGFYPAMLVSSAAFAYCHVYEGFFGVLNALSAGLFLFFLFAKRGGNPTALHGLAFAHGAYNALVYAAAYR